MNIFNSDESFNINYYYNLIKSDRPPGDETNNLNSKNLESGLAQKKTCILIVEDEDVTRETLAAILREKKYKVITAQDGYEAIANLQSTFIDVAIIDIKLPGINGVETYKIIKKKYPEIKGIMITAYALSSYIKNALESGAVSCLFKPFDVDELLLLIKDLCHEEKN